MIKHLFILFLIFLATACSLLETEQALPKVNLTTQLPDPNRIRFEGKGAGAGMMLMSSMGPTGIAIGVAIDEGIAKDIGEAANNAEINFAQDIEQAFKMRLQRYNQKHQQKISQAKLVIERYGFISSGGSDDQTTAQYKIKFQLNNAVGSDVWQQYQFPNEMDDKTQLMTYPLEQVKTDAKAMNALIDNGLSYFKVSL